MKGLSKMLNCENCGAPLDPYKWRCDYCGAYYFDLTAFDFTGDKPTFVKFKTPQGTITCLARPKIETVEVGSDYSYFTDGHSNIIKSYVVNKTCDINVKFSCYENPKNKALFQIDTREK